MDVLSWGGGLTSFDLAAQVYGAITLPDGRCSVSNAQHAAVRRALSSLQGAASPFSAGVRTKAEDGKLPIAGLARVRARTGGETRSSATSWILNEAKSEQGSRRSGPVTKRFAAPELLVLLRAPQPLGLRTAAEIARRLNGTGQRRLARVYEMKGKRQALALWARLRLAPGFIARRSGEKWSPMQWMPLSRRRLGPPT
jgi:hypothetical protein